LQRQIEGFTLKRDSNGHIPGHGKANLKLKRQMNEDSSRLFQLAAELNAELEIAGADVMPLMAAGKAERIEKLAHAVKEKMKLTMAN
jgi:hypothetical protein